MRTVLKFALAACVAQASFAQAPVNGFSTVKAFRPYLLVNEDESVCAPYLKAWTTVFDSREHLDEGKLDLAPAFPGAPLKVFTDFYENPQQMPIDFDGDGESEVLFFGPNDFSWRYSGPSLYIFDSAADFQKALDSKEHQAPWGLALNWGSKTPVPGASYRELIRLWSISAAPIVQAGDRIFTSTMLDGPTDKEPATASLVHLNAPGAVRTMCTVLLEPAYGALAQLRASSPLLAGATTMYGYPAGSIGMCWGTMGWSAPPRERALSTVIYRPWAIEGVLPDNDSMHAPRPEQADAARELRYLVWAASDPQSWATYLDVKRGRPKFLADLTAYYSERFDMAPDQARRLAEQSWKGVLDDLVYARNPDRSSLVFVAVRGDTVLPITPDTSPYDAVRIAIDAWLKQIASPEGEKPNFEDVIWADALVLAVRVRLPEETIAKVMAGFSAQPENSWRYSDTRGAALLAALGDEEMTRLMLDYGASPNSETNEFRKTPLMYAAQGDQLGAVRLLLSSGANVNAATDDTKACLKLERDNRTALMYAAENASPAVIEAILEAGAAVSVKDTQNNMALWYLGRNKKITDPAVRQRLSARLGA